MDAIPKSCNRNNKRYTIEGILQAPKKQPDPSQLLSLLRKILEFCSINTESSCEAIFQITSALLAKPYLSGDGKSIITSVHSKVCCEKCKSNPRNPQQYPYHLCNSCYQENMKSLKHRCFNCQCFYSNAKYNFDCGHLCIFCASLLIRKGGESCPVCQKAYRDKIEELKQMEFVCANCKNTKMIVQDCGLRLICRHYHCGECLLQDITEKKCITDDKALAGSHINYALEMISGKCRHCGVRKLRDQIFVKKCCFVDVCIGCQQRKVNCLVCRQKIS